MWPLVVFLSSLRLCPTSRLLTIVATNLMPTLFPFVLRLLVRCLGSCGTWRGHSDMFSYHNLAINGHILISTSMKWNWDENCVSCECNIWQTSNILWWNLFSALIDRDIFIFLPLNSFFNKFADLTCLFLFSFVFEIDACMCDKFGKTLDLGIFIRHTNLCYRLPQQLFNFLFRNITVETCCYGFAVTLLFIKLCWVHQFWFSLVPSYMEYFFSMSRDSFVDPFVPVNTFFLHFLDCWVRATQLVSDWVRDCL